MEQQEGQTKYGVYVRSMLNRKVALKITEVGKNIGTNLQKIIVANTEGKCIPEGYIRPSSVKVMAYSSGKIKDDHVEFEVVYECLLCYPVVDMIVDCTVTNVTHAGIHSHVKDKDSDNIPITVFIARDHNNTNKIFNTVKEGAQIEARIIGVRFELNDPSITAIAILLDKRGAGQERVYEVKKPLLKSPVEPVDEPVEEKKVSENKLEPTPIKK
jgi:DNA-directed RNA polymerase subunit E'/Rpb7